MTSWSGLTPAEAYAVLRLRCRVFVVEQECAYLDLDGRDLDDATEHVLISNGDDVAAYLRVLPAGLEVGHSLDPAGRAIGRVVTHPDHRGRGLAGSLLQAVISTHGDSLLTMHAQSHLTGWYARYGFTPCGPDFLDDGIPHTPLQRTAASSPGPAVMA
ncbi:GNAT family N-acetyltransferase [Spelaeicoccus albus]|uniref:ElaA protein n=1 Tax=Spelaeicoccus albus TaxID=1280376 RepID=A0A7Z0D3K0_9MICO|nr:GNAT family N-acetyltransferase [Spelaeicoccus albus]NYI68183.1 ElaA protein [Spelaeicoccus albus]